MARAFIAELKQAIGRGNTLAAMELLDRSIRFRHKKLAIYRYLVAEKLGAPLREEHRSYCLKVTQSLKDEDIAAMLVRINQLFEASVP